MGIRMWTFGDHSLAGHTGFELFWSRWSSWGIVVSFPVSPPFQHVPSQHAVRSQGGDLWLWPCGEGGGSRAITAEQSTAMKDAALEVKGPGV